jgi:chloramphenicol 3-O-phosphotransferase
MNKSGTLNFINYLIFSVLVFHSNAFSAHLILMNGASCSGKSSAAKATVDLLNKQEGERWELMSIDDQFLSGRKEAIYSSAEAKTLGEKLSFRAKLTYGLHQSVRKKLESGTNIILDHCFLYDDMFLNALFHFKKEEVFLVKISTDFETAKKRLKKRNLSPNQDEHRSEDSLKVHYGKGPAPAQITNKFNQNICASGLTDLTGGSSCFQGRPIHTDKVYDLEIDSTDSTSEEIAEKIKSGINNINTFKAGSFYRNHLKIWNRGRENWQQDSECVWRPREPLAFHQLYGELLKIFENIK